jgi:MscS family membrane protein
MQDQERRRKQVAHAVKIKTRISTFLILTIALALIAACASSGAGTPAVTNPPPPPTPAPGQDGTQPPATDDGGVGIAELATLAQVAPTRTPEPTATPDALTEAVEEFVQETGLAGQTLLGLSYEDWINLGISLLIVLGALLIGNWAARWLFPRLVQRTKTDLDDRLLQVAGSELRWLVVILILRFATIRLEFIGAGLKTTMADIYFLLILFLTLRILFRLINLAAQQADNRAKRAGRQKQAESLITLAVWTLRLIVLVLALSVSLAHFGIDITGFAVFLGIIGFALSLAGRDVLADVISGAIILIDQPYRIGDRIDLPALDSWGDVVDIGMRSTRILTLDNRMVVVPNSQIGKDQVVNYSDPDPSYYDQSEIVVAYDNDVGKVQQLLIDTLRAVEGVQNEREIDANLWTFRENEMVFQTGWWIESYEDLYPVRNRANRAMIQALKDAGVVLPYRQGRVDLATQTAGNASEEKNDDRD